MSPRRSILLLVLLCGCGRAPEPPPPVSKAKAKPKPTAIIFGTIDEDAAAIYESLRAKMGPLPDEVVGYRIGSRLQTALAVHRTHGIEQPSSHVPVTDGVLQPELLTVVHEQRETAWSGAIRQPGARLDADGDVGMEQGTALEDVVLRTWPAI